jgi:outer membrane protein OmpA-like peptidoglycan-associated protein
MRVPVGNNAPMNANGTPCEVIANALSGANNVLMSDANGAFEGAMRSNWGETEFVKMGYKKTKVVVGTLNGCVELTPDNCKVMNGNVINRTYNIAVPNAKVTVFNKCTGEMETYTSDADGKFEICLQDICDYEIVGEKEKIGRDIKQINLKNVPSTNSIRLELGNMAPTPAPVTVAPAPPAPVVSSATVSIGDRAIKVGETLKLDNIYYDFTKFFIREDAKPDLDKVVAAMSRYPNMRVELGSHTDARGSDDSNYQLSYNRAKAAVDYIVSRGIAPDRIVYKGYGESVILNQCFNGVKCSDMEHQVNRRTEVKVLSID